MSTYVLTRKGQTLETPSFINTLFNDKRFSTLWLAVLLVLAWKIAGYLGLDYFILPRVGDLWIGNKK